MPSSLGGEGRRLLKEGVAGGEEVLEFWRWMAGRWATMNQVKHGRRRHGPVRTCPVQGRASRKDNYVFRSDRRISARLGHDTDSSRQSARCLRINVQCIAPPLILSSLRRSSICHEIKIAWFIYAMCANILHSYIRYFLSQFVLIRPASFALSRESNWEVQVWNF